MADLSRTALELRVNAAKEWFTYYESAHSEELLDYIESLEDALIEEGLEIHVIT